VSADGKHVAAGLRHGASKVWGAADWEEGGSFPGAPRGVWSGGVLPAGKVLAPGGGGLDRGGLVHTWEGGGGNTPARLPPTGEVLSVAFSPDGKGIAAGAADKTVKVWKVTPRPE